nr:xylose isomerase [Anaerolineae bacterium]
DRIAHTHFKDFDPDAPGWGGRRGRMTLLGQGKVNFPSLVEILQEHNFNGWIVIEFDSRSDPRETAAANRRYVREELRLKIE